IRNMAAVAPCPSNAKRVFTFSATRLAFSPRNLGKRSTMVWKVPVKRPASELSWALYLIAALLLLFAGIAWAVFHGYSRALDVGAILSLRHLLDSIGPAWMGETARDVTSLGSVVVVCLVVAPFIGYLLLSGRRSSAIVMLISVAGG